MDKIPDLKKDLQPGTGANAGPVGYGVGVFIAAKTKKTTISSLPRIIILKIN